MDALPVMNLTINSKSVPGHPLISPTFSATKDLICLIIIFCRPHHNSLFLVKYKIHRCAVHASSIAAPQETGAGFPAITNPIR
jgi:hypothetical protein